MRYIRYRRQTWKGRIPLTSVLPLFLEVGIITLIACAVATWLITRYAVTRTRLMRVQREETDIRAGDFRRAYEQLRDATDSVIGELEAHPATYELFPREIRERLDAAHSRARELDYRRRNT
jgi:hypothetical protein